MSAELWPTYESPNDLLAIEAIPLDDRGLPQSTYAVVRRAAELWPDRIAISVMPTAADWRQPVQRTYVELLAGVHQQANLLATMGVDRATAVALISPNCEELITATLAAQLAGIAVPVNAALQPSHIAELVGRCGARVVIAADPNLDAASWAAAERLHREGVVDTVLALRATAAEVAEPQMFGELCDGYLADLAADFDADGFDGPLPTSEDLAAFFHTGGTTGAPKLAAHTHANEVSDAWMIAANSTLSDHATLFAALPLFHVNALVVTVLAPLLRGQHVVWAGPLGYRDPGLYPDFWKMVQHYRLSAMSAVPTVYSVLAECPVDADISSLRFAVVGASALPPAVGANFESRTGVRLVEGYGLTEATCASARSFADYPRPGSVGQRMPYQRLKAVSIDDNGTWTDLPPGEVGALVISGPTVFAGYVKGHTDAGYVIDGDGKLVDGWLDTGDLGRVDDDGFVYLTGRIKDLIIRGGHNIDPQVIEDALLAHPDVTAAAAVPRPDRHAGEVPVAYVTVRANTTASPEELCSWAAQRVPEPAAAPKSVTIVEAIPVTPVGKPYKLALRADAARRAVAEALAGHRGVDAITSSADDGTVAVNVTVAENTDTAEVQGVLAQFALTTRVTTAGRHAH